MQENSVKQARSEGVSPLSQQRIFWKFRILTDLLANKKGYISVTEALCQITWNSHSVPHQSWQELKPSIQQLDLLVCVQLGTRNQNSKEELWVLILEHEPRADRGWKLSSQTWCYVTHCKQWQQEPAKSSGLSIPIAQPTGLAQILRACKNIFQSWFYNSSGGE